MAGSDSDDEDDRGRAIGFFFGNVNEDGQLEEDYLDEVRAPTVAALMASVSCPYQRNVIVDLLPAAHVDDEGGLTVSRPVYACA